VDSKGDLYVADSRNNRIQKFRGKDWKFLKEIGGLFDEAKASGGVSQKLATGALGKFHEPNGVAIGPNDSVYVMDTWNNRVQVFNSNGSIKFAYTTDDGFFAPREIAVDSNGFSYVADTGKHRVVKFDPKGQKVMSIGASDPKTGQVVPGSKDGQFNEPIGLALDQGGNLYVADRLNFRIQVFGPDGQFVRKWTTKWLIPLQTNGVPEQVDIEPHLAMDQAHGLVYATDGKGKKVFCYKLDGTLVSTLETNTTGAPLFAVPIGVAVDKDSNVYVVDAGQGKIIKLKGQFQ
jgi:sugar lactone lactonase YvrE